MSETPRTDSEVTRFPIRSNRASWVRAKFAKRLERDLKHSDEDVERLAKERDQLLVELAEAKEQIRLLFIQQSHDEAARNQMMESGHHVQNERDQLRAENETLRNNTLLMQGMLEQAREHTKQAQAEVERLKKEAGLTFEHAKLIAIGCLDYGGGHRDKQEHLEIYHHGIQTVINALESTEKNGLSDTQNAALYLIGVSYDRLAKGEK